MRVITWITRMHYYQFNIGDYHSHTSHLEPLEDLAYRRMLDWLYLHEKPLPESVEDVARAIRMRTHCDCIANVLREFFYLENGWNHARVDSELAHYKDKSQKAKKSAKARWASKHAGLRGDANALRTESERNANHKPITNNHKPTDNSANATRFRPPTVAEVKAYCEEKGYSVDPERFVNFYESKGWLVGKTKMRKWKAAVANWEKGASNGQHQQKTGHVENPRRLAPYERVRAAAERAARERQG